MKVLSKQLRPAEVKCRCLVVPRDKAGHFPDPGATFVLSDGKSSHEAHLDSQFRLRSASWFREHRAIKAGDQITISKENGSLNISLLRSFLKPENETFDWTHQVLEAIKNGEIQGILKVDQHGFSVEIGEHIRETQIIFKAV